MRNCLRLLLCLGFVGLLCVPYRLDGFRLAGETRGDIWERLHLELTSAQKAYYAKMLKVGVTGRSVAHAMRMRDGIELTEAQVGELVAHAEALRYVFHRHSGLPLDVPLPPHHSELSHVSDLPSDVPLPSHRLDGAPPAQPGREALMSSIRIAGSRVFLERLGVELTPAQQTRYAKMLRFGVSGRGVADRMRRDGIELTSAQVEALAAYGEELRRDSDERSDAAPSLPLPRRDALPHRDEVEEARPVLPGRAALMENIRTGEQMARLRRVSAPRTEAALISRGRELWHGSVLHPDAPPSLRLPHRLGDSARRAILESQRTDDPIERYIKMKKVLGDMDRVERIMEREGHGTPEEIQAVRDAYTPPEEE